MAMETILILATQIRQIARTVLRQTRLTMSGAGWKLRRPRERAVEEVAWIVFPL
jgi:hypothetical protein